MTRLAQIEWILSTHDKVAPGDVVSTAAGGMPMYQVIDVDNGYARLRDEAHRTILTAPLTILPWKGRMIEN